MPIANFHGVPRDGCPAQHKPNIHATWVYLEMSLNINYLFVSGSMAAKALAPCLLGFMLALLAGLSVAAEPVRILILGDSLSAAYGMPSQDGWVALLEARLRANRDLALTRQPEVEIINASISGETTAGGLERLPALLAEQRPQLVIIALGANDGLRGFAVDDIGERLMALINMAEQADATVVLVGIRLPPNYGAVYREGFQRLFASVAEQTGVALVPRLLDGVAERWDLMQADGLHPRAEAQPLILNNLWPTVQEMLHAARN